jgi:putative flippase GtrA
MFEVIELNESKKIIKKLNVIIYGTIRDIEEHFIKSFTNIDLLSKLFNNVYIIIFENDSSDNTRNLLRIWASSHDNNVVKHIILENNLIRLIPLRATRLAYCRNKILNYIFENNLDKSYQYAIHCDLDDRFWSLDYVSICNCFQYDLNTWDAMFPININYSYYDFWALRCNETWFKKNIFCCEIENNEKCNQYENHIKDFGCFLKKNKNSLISVNSAFNGIGIYKLNSLKNCKYDATYFCNNCRGKSIGCKEDNDHIGLHRDMIFNNAKLFINTKMVLENNKKYISYKKFIKNLENIPNIKKDPLKYVFYTKIVDQNHLWLNFSNKLGNYENIISNFSTNNIFTFCKNDNNLYSNELINNNVVKYIENIPKNINKFILNNYNSVISFIHIDINNYHNTKLIFEKLHKKINNGCIIVINKFLNYNEYLLHDLHAFYEFTQKYNIKFEYIGINGNFFVNPPHHIKHNTSVAIKIIENPNISNIEITNDFFKYEESYIYFDWITYVNTYQDISCIKNKEDAWDHWINYGKAEGRQYFTKETKENDNKKFDWIQYIKTYSDLNHINNKEEAWNHWTNYGKAEGRQYFSIKTKSSLDNIEDDTYFFLNWTNYIELNDDLKHIKTKEEAWNHWINYGKAEGRPYFIKKIEPNTNTNTNTQNEKQDTFDWKKYITKNKDLIHIKTKDDAWSHWINYGKNEGRKFYNYPKSNHLEFDWKYYVTNNGDLNHITTEEEALFHWNNFGKNEGRICSDVINKEFVKFNNFDWKYYIENNSDLNTIKTKEEAWDHWEKYGKYENRLFKQKIIKKDYIF